MYKLLRLIYYALVVFLLLYVWTCLASLPRADINQAIDEMIVITSPK